MWSTVLAVVCQRICALACCSVLLIVHVAAQTIQPGTTWVNEGGSELTINTVNVDGSLNGTYINRVAGFNCQNEPMSVNGWVEGGLLSFSVRWKNANKDCKSITTWTGYLASGKLFAEWDLIYTAASTGLPTHLRNANVFSPK